MQWDQMLLEYLSVSFPIPACLSRFARASPSLGAKDLKRTETPSQRGGEVEANRKTWGTQRQVGSLHPSSPRGSTISPFPSLPFRVSYRAPTFCSPIASACMAGRGIDGGTDWSPCQLRATSGFFRREFFGLQCGGCLLPPKE